MLELYHFWDSPCCFKVRTVLAEYHLEWTERYIMTVHFDHLQPEYQILNPHSRVPTLVYDGLIVIQSSVIAEYIDDQFGNGALKPKSAAALAVMREWMADEQEYLFPLIVPMSFNTMMKLRSKAYGLDQLIEWSKRHPDQIRAKDYLQRMSGPADMDAVVAAEKKFAWHMERLETQLQKTSGPWICGDDYSLADISVAPLLDRVEHLDRSRLYDALPLVAGWYQRMKERPAFMKATPPPEFRMWGPVKPIPAQQVDAAAAGYTFPSD
jgi:glutathione S-transferase